MRFGGAGSQLGPGGQSFDQAVRQQDESCETHRLPRGAPARYSQAVAVVFYAFGSSCTGGTQLSLLRDLKRPGG
jgi:hypothetical protein